MYKINVNGIKCEKNVAKQKLMINSSALFSCRLLKQSCNTVKMLKLEKNRSKILEQTSFIIA